MELYNKSSVKKYLDQYAPNKEVKNFTRKLETGLRLAEKRMLEEKALRDETIVVSSAEGGFQYIPAKEVLAMF